MIEAVALWFLSRRVVRMADERRRDRAWGALAIVAWISIEYAVWKIAFVAGLGWASYVPALLCGAAAGFGVFAALRSLPALPVFDPSVYDDTWSEAACPRCGSEQTYLAATKLRCFNCEYVGKPTMGRPRVGMRTVRSYP
jgi:hypothetical protein